MAKMSRRVRKDSIVRGNTLCLIIPLTPSGNKLLSWTYKRSRYLTVHKRDVQDAVFVAVHAAMGAIPAHHNQHWAKKATLGIVRCSPSKRAIDDDNVIIGTKYARDAMIKAGVIIDDNPHRLTLTYPIVDKPQGQWGDWYGPATHLIVERYE